LICSYLIIRLPWWLRGKESGCNVGDLGPSLGWEDPLKKGNGNPFGTILAMDRGVWWVTVHGVTKS